MVEIKEKISKKILIEFSGEHLYYEIDMLYNVSRLLTGQKHEVYYFDALLESFVIHASNVLDFFYKPQVKADDALAIHYINNTKDWYKKLPLHNKYFQKFHTKRNKHVMHLSYKRLDVKPEQKSWRVTKITKEIKKIVDNFLDAASPALIHPSLYKLRSVNKTS